MKKGKNESIILKGAQEVELDFALLRKGVLVLRAVNHKIRQGIIELLQENEKMSVTDLYIKLRLEQSVASQHLAILRRVGVVTTDRTGKFIHYSLDKKRLEEIMKLVDDIVHIN
jgi:DNA-binding transcriptional ArsR family regulator